MNSTPSSHSRTVSDWISEIKKASGAGNYLLAIDVASDALKEYPKSLELEYRRLLALARAGATRPAIRNLNTLERDGALKRCSDPVLLSDFAALSGRLLKDQAAAAGDVQRRSLLARQAAEAYGRAYGISPGSFSAINAATLWMIADEVDKAKANARIALDHAAAETDPYWKLATEAEALVLLGDDEAAGEKLRQAVIAAGTRQDDIATTRRQLNWLARTTGLGLGVLPVAPAPLVLHWMSAPDNRLKDDLGSLASTLSASGGFVAFGSVLSVADLDIAEALLARGGQLELVLPCASDLCRASLVAKGGSTLGPRFDELLRKANVSVVTLAGDSGEPSLVRSALTQARGHALLRSAYLVAPVRVMYCADGRVQQYESTGSADIDQVLASWPAPTDSDSVWSQRTNRAIVFGDVRGFSLVPEARQPSFFDKIIGGFGDALAFLGSSIEYTETAGDGIYLVLRDVHSAVQACRALHAVMAPARLRDAGMPADMALRLSSHFGPVFRGVDRVTGRRKFFGGEVIRTARIEPVAPPGETYVTEQFAAQLCSTGSASFECDYVGIQSMAKGYGQCRMYWLRPKPA